MEEVTRSRAVVTAAIAVALLFVVAAAAGVAGGKQATSTAVSGTPEAATGLGGPTWAGSLVMALVSAAGVWVIYTIVPGLLKRRPRRTWTKRPWWYWPVLVAVLAAVSGAFLFALSWLLRVKVHLAQSGGVHPVPLKGFMRLSGGNIATGGGGGNGASWIAIVAGAALAVVAIIASYVWRRRRWGTGPVAGGLPRRGLDEQRRQVVEVIDESLEALEAEPDPRKAVIAAYVRMDRWLARAGFGRRSSEAPFEHLDRIVDGLGATTAVGGTLAGLYERAKFDYRPCGPEMKQAAIAALVQLREELASLPSKPAQEPAGGATGNAPEGLSGRAGSRSGSSVRPAASASGAGMADGQVGLT
jgi:hypothetical protein